MPVTGIKAGVCCGWKYLVVVVVILTSEFEVVSLVELFAVDKSEFIENKPNAQNITVNITNMKAKVLSLMIIT